MVRNSRSTSSLDAASTMKTKARSPTGSPPARIFLSPSNFTRVSNVGRMMFSKTSAVSIGEANPGPSDPVTRYFMLLLPSLLLRVINVACTLKSPRPYCKPKESLPLRSKCELCAHQGAIPGVGSFDWSRVVDGATGCLYPGDKSDTHWGFPPAQSARSSPHRERC